MRSYRFLILVLATLTVPACAGHGSYVDTDDAALGRVVVYRNGIAYYERRAHVTGNTLSLSVPHDKVDDFLKSLTVEHVATGEAVPISYPTLGATHDDVVEMEIKLPDSGPHDLLITYITEAPAWKPSYRVVVGDDGLELQGWAIVDNTSGEDWESVRVGVGSSSALSFRYDLRSVVNVHRETLGDRLRFAYAPPSGGAVHGEDKKQIFLARLEEEALPMPDGHPSAAAVPLSVGFAGTGRGGGGSGALDAGGRYSMAVGDLAAPEKAQKSSRRDLSRVRALAKQLQSTTDSVVIEGYASNTERDAEGKSLDRANRLRNELIAQGVAPMRLSVVARGNVSGKSAGVELKLAEGGDAGGDEGPGDPVGESHFESNTPMTIPRGTSAMVSIINTKTPGEVVYLYAPDDARGHKRFAFKAVRFENPSDSTLETGPVTVYGNGRFIGEGLTDSVPPGATTVVPFALDRQIVVESKTKTSDRIASLLKVNRGVCTAEIKHIRTTKLAITNRLGKAARLFVRHQVRKGWNLEKSPTVFERQGEAHLFDVHLEAGETKTVEIVEATPLERTVDLRSDLGVDMLRTYLSAGAPDPEFADAMRNLLAIHDEMSREVETIASLQERIGEYRTRNNELHFQIASLRLVRVRGGLMVHLRRKMKETSQRVQQATIDIVNHKEKLMLSRIRFQDGLSELSLDPVVAAAHRGAASEG
jgi:hypothetical protein